jgi:spore maturation protein CgeB
MRIVYFTHSLTSCWNHGNAHFLRGVLRELMRLGHEVRVFEPQNGWSLANLLADHGEAGLAAYRAAYPELSATTFGEEFDVSGALDGADLVIVHEWNAPALVAAIGRARARGGRFVLLFHDTHHRAVSDPEAIRAFDLSAYDGVLAFGEALAEVYRRWGWGRRAIVWHEAADTSLFRPPAGEGPREGVVWIGNWGDGERTAELETFLLAPARAAGLELDVHGVRYPAEAFAMLGRYGARYRGWLPNPRAPEVFARRLATVHVPRRFYVQALPGIPTIRVFEALACGVPLACAPWSDSEGLFRPGEDFLVARDGAEMAQSLRALSADPALRASLVRSGLERIRTRHTCAHRAHELLAVHARLSDPPPQGEVSAKPTEGVSAQTPPIRNSKLLSGNPLSPPPGRSATRRPLLFPAAERRGGTAPPEGEQLGRREIAG